MNGESSKCISWSRREQGDRRNTAELLGGVFPVIVLKAGEVPGGDLNPDPVAIQVHRTCWTGLEC